MNQISLYQELINQFDSYFNFDYKKKDFLKNLNNDFFIEKDHSTIIKITKKNRLLRLLLIELKKQFLLIDKNFYLDPYFFNIIKKEFFNQLNQIRDFPYSQKIRTLKKIHSKEFKNIRKLNLNRILKQYEQIFSGDAEFLEIKEEYEYIVKHYFRSRKLRSYLRKLLMKLRKRFIKILIQIDFITILLQEFNLEQKIQEFLHKLENLQVITSAFGKIYEYLDLNVWDHFNQWWDLSKGNWQKTINIEELEKYIKIIKGNPKIKELIDQLGRLEKIENAKVNFKYHWEYSNFGKSEIVGVHFSNDLSSLLASEVALLSEPETENLFNLNYAEKKLLTYEYDEKVLYQEQETILENKYIKGPIILILDTSESMKGQPEILSKAIALALLRKALKENRECFVIFFSDQIQCKELKLNETINSLIDLTNFISMGFHGGTDFDKPLEKALEILSENKNYKYADVLVISDFVTNSIDDKIKEQIENQKEKGTKFYGLIVRRFNIYNREIIEIFDVIYEAKSKYHSINLIEFYIETIKKFNE